VISRGTTPIASEPLFLVSKILNIQAFSVESPLPLLSFKLLLLLKVRIALGFDFATLEILFQTIFLQMHIYCFEALIPLLLKLEVALRFGSSFLISLQLKFILNCSLQMCIYWFEVISLFAFEIGNIVALNFGNGFWILLLLNVFPLVSCNCAFHSRLA